MLDPELLLLKMEFLWALPGDIGSLYELKELKLEIIGGAESLPWLNLWSKLWMVDTDMCELLPVLLVRLYLEIILLGRKGYF